MPDVSLSFRKEFGTTVAVDDIDLTIKDGEFVTLVGPSGCGKTTTLRIVAGLEQPSEGTVHFGNRDVTKLPPQERNVALLFQNIALYPHMSVMENMAYGLKIAGVPKSDRQERVTNAAEMLQIGDLLDNNPGQLSGGQQQRVALGRSIVRDPDIFLFDEPMSNLDAKLKRELRPLVVEVTEQIGCPTLYVTHDQEEAMSMSDRVAVMNQGNVEQVGSPQDIYKNPNSRFVGEFIGQPSMEFFEGHIVSSNNGVLEIEIEGWEFEVSKSVDKSLNHGDNVTIGVRPQGLNISDAEGFSAKHIMDEPLGEFTHSFFEIGNRRITVVTDPEFRGEQQEYQIKPDVERVMLFDYSTDARLA